jgi:hypothetical protein
MYVILWRFKVDILLIRRFVILFMDARKLRQCVIVLEQRLDHTKLNRPRLARRFKLKFI